MVSLDRLYKALRARRRSLKLALDPEVLRRRFSGGAAGRRAVRKTAAARRADLATDRLARANEKALVRRPFLNPGYEFRPISTHDKEYQALKRAYPYFGFINVEVEDVPPFVMFSNNDDRVAQTYFWYGPNAFESPSLRIWRDLARRSKYIFDVGAFTGVYSLTAARANRGAEVYAFEPIKRVFGRLVINLVANRLGGRVKASDIALGGADGQATMNLFQDYRTISSGSSLIEKSGKRIVTTEYVETRRFDTFVEERGIPGVDLVKIDVEQAEKMVIEGMADTLREHRPHLLVEVLSQQNLLDLFGMLQPHGYSFALINDTAQRFHVNDPDAHRRVSNVLFSPMAPDELRAFCRAVKPL